MKNTEIGIGKWRKKDSDKAPADETQQWPHPAAFIHQIRDGCSCSWSL